MACRIFEEDEVYALTEKGYRCGLVVESSEFVSSDEEVSTSPFFESVRKGTLRVAWHPDGKEEVIQESKIKLADRSLMPGDVVRRLIEGENSQRGYVCMSHIKCHLQVLGTNTVLCNVDSKDLQPLVYWDPEPGDVYLDGWVGKIDKVLNNIILQFPDGARCQLDDGSCYNFLSVFEDINDKREVISEFYTTECYPGQKLKGQLSHLRAAQWLRPTKTYCAKTAKKGEVKEVVVTVISVEPKLIEAYWLCRGCNKGLPATPPTKLKENHIKRLKKLDYFEACSTQIGDKGFYVIKDSDEILTVTPKGKHSLLHYIVEERGSEHITIEKHNVQNSTKLTEHSVDRNNISSRPCTGQVKDIASDTKIENVADEENTKLSITDNAIKIAPKRNGKSQLSEQGQLNVASRSHEEEWTDEEDGDVDSDTGSVASSASLHSDGSPSSKKKNKRGAALQTKLLKKKKYRKSRSKPEVSSEADGGNKVAVEVIYTASYVDVMWQDGSIEKAIPSTDLFPIHHLDDHEFFPGDFAVRAGESSGSNVYGVVEKVNHSERTCQIQWMQPYDVNKGTRPAFLNAVKEEDLDISVYDIKDHPDYKFRPGNIAVRVGGYEDPNEELDAAGQIVAVGMDGRLLVHWPSGYNSQCYPQELYSHTEEFSDVSYSSSDYEDDKSWDVSDESDASWVTEEDDDDSSSEEEEKVEKVVVKVELDRLFSTVQTNLQKLDETFGLGIDIGESVNECYRNILHISRDCRRLDKVLNSNYFKNANLTLTLSAIKKELKKAKAIELVKRVDELVARNRDKSIQSELSDVQSIACQTGTPSAENVSTADQTCVLDRPGKPYDVPPPTSISEQAHDLVQTTANLVKEHCSGSSVLSETQYAHLQTDRPICSSQVHLQTELTDYSRNLRQLLLESCVPALENLLDTKLETPPGDCVCSKAPPVEPLVTDTNHEQGALSADIVNNDPDRNLSSNANPLSKSDCENADLANPIQAENAVDHKPASDADSFDVNDLKPQELCQKACQLLFQQIQQVHEEFEKRWEQINPGHNAVTAADEAVAEDNRSGQEKLEGAVVDETTTEKVAPDKLADSDISKDKKASDHSKLKDDLSLDISVIANGEDEVPANPMTPQTPAEIRAKLEYNTEGFNMLESTPESHKFYSSCWEPSDNSSFFTAVRKELKMLSTSLPKGIFVKGFEDRMDLFTVMVKGPAKTPYEDGLFFFDVRLPNDYPQSPPLFHYISYTRDRLNPNLYDDGKVCISLLGTWTGKGTEVWTSTSSFLQVLISIQGLILVSEPYYNEAGYERQRGTQHAQENSRMYNEMAILKMIQSLTTMTQNPPVVFESEVIDHMKSHAFRLIQRLLSWISITSPTPTAEAADMTSVCSNQSCQANSTQDPAVCPVSNQSLEATSGPTGQYVTSLEATSGPTGQYVASNKYGPQMAEEAGSAKFGCPPEFPLLPPSKGFKLTLRRHLQVFREVLGNKGIIERL